MVGQQFIEINGQRRHAISYLGDFLFAPDRIRTPVKALSGGEINRAILARLFTRPANLLILDEPTNDLDIETLELLEEILLEFKGTIILVSHDRHFLDKVVTSLLVMKGNSEIEEQAGSYADWEARGGQLNPATPAIQASAAAQQTQAETLHDRAEALSNHAELARSKTQKLSYREQRELDGLPAHIEALEASHTALLAAISEKDFYEQAQEHIAAALTAVTESERALDAALERLIELEG